MKRMIAMLLALLLLSGCSAPEAQPAATETLPDAENVQIIPDAAEIPYESRFDNETEIRLSDDGLDVTGPNSLTVFASHDIVYYEDRDFYESGNPYGEGEDADKHTAEEAAKHTVVNITKPGTYRVTGKLSAGQIRIDLGEDAYDDPNAVVELILDNADITCTVAPAILFLNVYECDGNWDTDTAKPDVDTTRAGANLILEGSNAVNGSYVAKIYKDKDGEKKLWKQDGAIYSYMSMNVFGPGSLDLTAENEGMDTELHLTIHGGDIAIRSGNDGINTNEDGVSVTTINGGNLHIMSGLGAEGDGIDSNGYLVINGGTVVSAAHPASDAGLDSDLGSFIHGGTVIALGSTMDWAESDSEQVTMNLQFAAYQAPTDSIVVKAEDGTEIFSYDPATDAVLGDNARKFMGAVISCPDFKQGETYRLYVGGQQMQYTGTDVRRGPGGFGGFGGEFPDNAPPEGLDGEGHPRHEGERPEPPEGLEGERPQWPGGDLPDNAPPEGFDGRMPEAFGEFPGEGRTLFYMQDKVNCFSGITAVSE